MLQALNLLLLLMTFKVQSRTDAIDSYLGVFPCRRIPSQNIVHRLASRQLVDDCPARNYYRQRSLYQCIVPNHTESHVQVPPGYLRKFSPNGRSLLAFSSDQKSVLVYEYLGCGACCNLFSRNYKSIDEIKLNLFDQLFKLRHLISSFDIQENLNRECSLFTEESRYVIVGSSMFLHDDPYPPLYSILRGNEDISPQANFRLEDYTLYIVDMLGGFVTDSCQFKCDKIQLAHNQGLSLCGSKFAVLSIQHQTIHLFQIRNGTFVQLHQVGRFCYPDDRIVYERAESDLSTNAREGTGEHLHHPFHEKWYNSLKHRLLCWLLRHAEVLSASTNRVPVMNFFQRFDDVASLRMWKMQLLSNHKLLIRYAKEDAVTSKSTDPISQPALLVVYNLESTEIEAVFENTSEDLLRIYERHADSFRVPVSHSLCHDISSVSNNAFAHSLHMKFKDTITSAKFGGRREAVRRLLGQLPISSQCHSSSPYLDLALFSYDDKWVSAVERPKPCGDSPVKYVMSGVECRSVEVMSSQ